MHDYMDLYAKVHTHVYAYNACMHTCNKSLVECLDQSNSAYVPPPVGVLHHARLFTAGSGWRRGRGFICRGSPFVGLPLQVCGQLPPGIITYLSIILIGGWGFLAAGWASCAGFRAVGLLAASFEAAAGLGCPGSAGRLCKGKAAGPAGPAGPARAHATNTTAPHKPSRILRVLGVIENDPARPFLGINFQSVRKGPCSIGPSSISYDRSSWSGRLGDWEETLACSKGQSIHMHVCNHVPMSLRAGPAKQDQGLDQQTGTPASCSTLRSLPWRPQILIMAQESQ